MSLNAKNAPRAGGSSITPLEAGTYPARVVQIIDCGLQEQRPFNGTPKPPAQDVILTYEFVDEFILDEDGQEQKDKPRWLSETFPLFNLEADRAKSTQRYMALDPEMEHDGDFSALVGTPCLVTIVQNPGKGKSKGKVFNNIGGVSRMRDKDAKKCPELVNKPVVFLLDEPDMEVFVNLPGWIKDKIKGNLEFPGSVLEDELKKLPEESKERAYSQREDVPDEDEDGEDPY